MESTISVTGEARSKQKNQLATFNAGVNLVKDKREDATNEMNSKMKALSESLKTFGIKSEDIKTTGLNFYQNPENAGTYPGAPKPGSWNVSSNIEITLREVDRANALADLLSSSGANNVSGPNFMMDDTATRDAEKGLVDLAMTNAREKAEAMASAAGVKLGRVVTFSEGYMNPYPPMYANYAMDMAKSEAGSVAPTIEPGSKELAINVSVTYEIE
jgi:uncharacterized protein YggE